MAYLETTTTRRETTTTVEETSENFSFRPTVRVFYHTVNYGIVHNFVLYIYSTVHLGMDRALQYNSLRQGLPGHNDFGLK